MKKYSYIAIAAALYISTGHATIPSSERQVLLNLYSDTNGSAWTNKIGWGGPVGTECNWSGVYCDSYGNNVTGIMLSGNNMSGSLPDISGLTYLVALDVSNNNISGSIPPISNLWSLASFWVQNNQLTGSIPALTGLPSLQDFEVQYNNLTGHIPPLSGLPSFGIFVANNNQLTGSIPSFPVAGSRPITFVVSNNQLTGSIPTLSGTFLYQLDVDNNQLTGSIPSIAGLSDLYYFSVAKNQLTGAIPALDGLFNLTTFDIGYNRLSGTIPAVPSPDSLTAGGSRLCPNLLDTAPSANDAGWDAATGNTPWWATPYLSNECDDIFTDRFGG